MKRRAKLLSILVLTAVAALALAEGAVRAFRPQPAFYASPGLYVADPLVRHRLRPGLRGVVGNWSEFTTRVRINALGIRGPEIGPRRPGVHRMLVLGDSFTFGTGVEEAEAFPAEIADGLTRGGTPAEGVNAGIGGYGVPDEVAWFEHYGMRLHPDLIVLGIFTGNDLQDAAPDRPRSTAPRSSTGSSSTPSSSPCSSTRSRHRSTAPCAGPSTCRSRERSAACARRWPSMIRATGRPPSAAASPRRWRSATSST
jgi:hypothetical protein